MLFGLLFLASCNEDETFVQEVETEDIVPNSDYENGLLAKPTVSNEGLELGCVDISFPFSMVTFDEETIEINSESDFVSAIENTENPPIDFVYPITVVESDGNTITTNDVDELADVFTDCIPNYGWGDDHGTDFVPAFDISSENTCLDLVYPFTIRDLDYQTVEVNNESELNSYLTDPELYSFVFPLDLVKEDGTAVTAEDGNQLFSLLANCGSGNGISGGFTAIGHIGCYQLLFPFSFELADGSTVEITDEQNLLDILLNEEVTGFVFPLTLQDEMGQELVIGSESELDDALAACGGSTGDGTQGLRCYLFDFPISVELFDGSTQTINNGVEFDDVFASGDWAGFAFPLPLFTADSTTGDLIPFTVNSQAELDAALEECENSTNDASADLACYNYVYPFEIENTETGEKFTVNSKQEFIDLTSPANWFPYNYVLPLSLEHKDTGDVITVSTPSELSSAIYDCY